MNYPVDLYCWKIGPALAVGCPIVMKSPHETPLAIAMLIDCLHEAGLPAGCIADLPGLGPVAGAALAAHRKVRVISATASVPAGQAILRAAAGNLKRTCLELGDMRPSSSPQTRIWKRPQKLRTAGITLIWVRSALR